MAGLTLQRYRARRALNPKIEKRSSNRTIDFASDYQLTDLTVRLEAAASRALGPKMYPRILHELLFLRFNKPSTYIRICLPRTRSLC